MLPPVAAVLNGSSLDMSLISMSDETSARQRGHCVALRRNSRAQERQRHIWRHGSRIELHRFPIQMTQGALILDAAVVDVASPGVSEVL